MNTIKMLKRPGNKTFDCKYGTFSKKNGFCFKEEATKSAFNEWDYEKIVGEILDTEWKVIVKSN